MKTCSILEFGAKSGEKSTAAIQKAIDECFRHGGGTVVVENGTFITGTLFLNSNVTLEIAAGATLLASPDTDDYPEFEWEWNREDAPRHTVKCLIYIGKCENVSIIGAGSIECNGKSFCAENPNPWKGDDDPHVEKRMIRTTILLPARMIFVMNSKNVTLRDFTMTDIAGGWATWINHCEYVMINRLKIYCHPYYPNADGVHINCCRDVFVTDCAIHTGDDCVIVRANTNTLNEDVPCENIIVKGCSLSSYCNAVRVGWRNDGEIKNCVFSDLVITNSRDALTIELPRESSPSDIGRNVTRIENICFSNVVIDSTDRYPVNISVFAGNEAEYIRSIKFCGIVSRSSRFPLLLGREDMKLENITFSDCSFRVTDAAEQRFQIRNVRNLKLNIDVETD